MFSTEVTISNLYLNYGGHVGDIGYVALAQEARMRWLKSRGVTEIDLGDGVGYVIASGRMEYKGESVHGDVLAIEIACANLKSRGFDFLYKMVNVKTGRVAAAGDTSQVFYDYRIKKVSQVPPKFKEWFF